MRTLWWQGGLRCGERSFKLAKVFLLCDDLRFNDSFGGIFRSLFCPRLLSRCCSFLSIQCKMSFALKSVSHCLVRCTNRRWLGIARDKDDNRSPRGRIHRWHMVDADREPDAAQCACLSQHAVNRSDQLDGCWLVCRGCCHFACCDWCGKRNYTLSRRCCFS